MLKKIFFLCVTLVPFSLNADGPFDAVMGYFNLTGGSWLTTIEIKATKDMNHLEGKGEDPCKLALVFSNSKELEAKLMGLSGPAFFAALEQIKKDHGTNLYIIVMDVLPNDQRTIVVKPTDPTLEGIYESTKFVVGYVSYQTPGDHRFTILSGPEKVTLNFGPSDVAVVTEQKK